eukprot:CAMPEP_0181229284 /NCGR_PEP_ID=MMETSP1096-20121128/33810_1 /TAXON_ID=156174 ORGANISM="Chrysochromulina ericina, Strain CCMP281" /NCGR_SAMPLE_ID=MMETSP1096 /ASSEMBLY_ACC=CAM_ASM_000453 /LENGTH=221 /DNA_ID=CAMNT_0023322887 /DNA_START=248 /DNA_END=910 /DNA_ORIENTATION=+
MRIIRQPAVAAEECLHVEHGELALVGIEGAIAAIWSGGGDVHLEGGVVVDGDVKVARLHVGGDVGDRELRGEVAVELLKLVAQHRVVIRAVPIHPPVDNVVDRRVPGGVGGQQVGRLDHVGHERRVLEAAKVVSNAVAHAQDEVARPVGLRDALGGLCEGVVELEDVAEEEAERVPLGEVCLRPKRFVREGDTDLRNRELLLGDARDARSPACKPQVGPRV